MQKLLHGGLNLLTHAHCRPRLHCSCDIYYKLEHPYNSRNLNPVPYHATYMGHKMHMDQNEKLVMFGVTHVMGHSKKVVGHCTMPVKKQCAHL